MEVEIRPEPDEPAAVLAAVEALLSADGTPPAYRSSWRLSGIRENVEDDAVRAAPCSLAGARARPHPRAPAGSRQRDVGVQGK
jgi:hypothetical protein